MLIRSLVSILIIAASFVLVPGQAQDAKKAASDKPTILTNEVRTERGRDLPFPTGIDLQFLIKELAREMNLNVVFDSESFRASGRKVMIDLKNVTAAEALNYILLQESLYSEEVGPKTIIVALQSQVKTSIPYFGVNLMPLSNQLAQYFGVKAGILITTVREESPGSKAGLKAGDVITTIDDQPFWGALSLTRTLKDESKSEITLKIVRDKLEQTISLTRDNGIK